MNEAKTQRQDILRQLDVTRQELQREKTKNQCPTISDNDFLKLCNSTDTGKFEEAIINGANVNARDNAVNSQRRTALICAAWFGHTEVAELLVKHGADINAEGNDGETALMLAAICKNTETLELLLKCGANVNARDNMGRTVLFSANYHCPEFVELLLKYGADVNAKDNDSETALMQATIYGFT